MKRILISVSEDDIGRIIDTLFEKQDLRERLDMDSKDKRRSISSIIRDLTEQSINAECDYCGESSNITVQDINENSGVEIYEYV